MPFKREEVEPEADQTKYGVTNTVGDVEILPAPNANQRWHITYLLLTTDNPGTDEVTITLKSDSDTLAVLVLNPYAVALSAEVQIIGGYGEAINIELDSVVNVHYTVSYYLRSDGKTNI